MLVVGICDFPPIEMHDGWGSLKEVVEEEKGGPAPHLISPPFPKSGKSGAAVFGERTRKIKTKGGPDKALQLSIAGFTNVEIGNLLQTNPAVIASNLYAERKKKKKKVK